MDIVTKQRLETPLPESDTAGNDFTHKVTKSLL
jgi:hypothetical protein